MKFLSITRSSLMRLLNKFIPPCPECPYTLGLVRTLANPCPDCRENGYATYERFCKHGALEYGHGENQDTDLGGGC